MNLNLSPLNFNFVSYIQHCPYNLSSRSQLTCSLNCSIIFNVYSFVIQEHGTSCLIDKEHESKGLYYQKTNCFASATLKLFA